MGDRGRLVVVTGAMGFIGHHVSVHLASRGYRVVGLDNFSRASRRAVRMLEQAGIEVYEADVTDPGRLEDMLGDAYAVVHAAALVSVAESMERPVLYAENNVVGTVSVLRAAVKAGVELLVYLSSASVYGEPAYLPIDEAHPLRPRSPYGASKLAGEIYVEAFRRAYGSPDYVILRLFNVYGPGQDPSSPYSGVVARFIAEACRGRPPVIYGDGLQTRDFVHVSDVARAVELALSVSAGVGARNQVYNIASGKPTSIVELARLVLEVVGAPDISPVHRGPRPGDIRHSYASVERAARMLGFEPLVGLREGLASVARELCG